MQFRFEMNVTNETGKHSMQITVSAAHLRDARAKARSQYPEWNIDSWKRVTWRDIPAPMQLQSCCDACGMPLDLCNGH